LKDVAGSGAKWLDVDPARFPGWIASFARRHDAGLPDASLTVTLAGDGASFTAPDGAVAECHPPFPPVPELAEPLPAYPDVAEAIAAHAQRPRAVGVLLVRLGGYAAGVFTGSPPRLADAKTGSRPVHGPRLAPYLKIATDRFLTVPDPRRRVLEDSPRLFLAVKIRLTEPTP